MSVNPPDRPATFQPVVLVPSIMELMGRANWWVPRWLQAFARRGASFDEDRPLGREELEPVAG
jgi:hypothetical protein